MGVMGLREGPWTFWEEAAIAPNEGLLRGEANSGVLLHPSMRRSNFKLVPGLSECMRACMSRCVPTVTAVWAKGPWERPLRKSKKSST